MIDQLWLLIVKNWKTTCTGLLAVIVWVCNNLFGIGLTAEQVTAINSILLALGLFFAKDGDKTGLKEPSEVK